MDSLVIGKLIDAVPLSCDADPHFHPVALPVIAVEGLPASVIPLVQQIAVLVIGKGCDLPPYPN